MGVTFRTAPNQFTDGRTDGRTLTCLTMDSEIGYSVPVLNKIVVRRLFYAAVFRYSLLIVLTKLLMRIFFFVFMQPNVVLSLCVVIFFKKAVTFFFGDLRVY